MHYQNVKTYFNNDKNNDFSNNRLPFTIESSMNIDQAIQAMKERKASSIGVTRFGEFIGILTERDLLYKLFYSPDSAHTSIVQDILREKEDSKKVVNAAN